MAILTGITGAVRANIAGFASQKVRAGTDRIRNLAGLSKEGGNSGLGEIFNAGQRTNSNIFSYPINVDSDPQQGHYIMFFINERIPGKLAKNKGNKNLGNASKKIVGEANAPFTAADGQLDEEEKIIASQKIADYRMEKSNNVSAGKLNRSIVLEKLPTQRLKTSIALYMPPSVSVEYKVNYGDQKIGSLAAVGAAAIEAFRAGAGTKDTLTKIADELTGSTAKEGLKNLANASLDTLAPGALALSQLESGTVITPRMEMMFEGVGRRQFTYTFNFLPKSAQEAQLVEQIIYQFKFYAMPKYSNPTTRREMDIPGTFDIQYMYRGSENSFLNRVSTCFLQNVSVEYGADRFTAYQPTPSKFGSGPPPQKSKLTLNFTELEVLSQDHIAQGF
tara:strand:- start:202 stop:1374 length:1173 start_codon:yes stop_codon:yes gene_type:complete